MRSTWPTQSVVCQNQADHRQGPKTDRLHPGSEIYHYIGIATDSINDLPIKCEVTRGLLCRGLLHGYEQ